MLPEERDTPDPSVVWLRRLRARARLDDAIGAIRANPSRMLDAAHAASNAHLYQESYRSRRVHGAYLLMRSSMKIPKPETLAVDKDIEELLNSEDGQRESSEKVMAMAPEDAVAEKALHLHTGSFAVQKAMNTTRKCH